MRKQWLSGGVMLAILVIMFGVGPFFYSNESILFEAMMYLVLAQGINILYGFTGYLPFGYVGFFGAGAYGAALAINDLHVSPVIGMLIGGLVATVVGLILTPLLRLSGAYFAIGSLAASEIIYYVISNPNLKSVTNGPFGIDLSRVFNDEASYFTMFAALILAFAFVIYIRSSNLGMSLLAIRDDTVSSEMAGINVVRTRVIAWLASAFFAGLVGAIYGWHISVFYPESVFNLSISIFAIVFTLFGGRATVVGPFIGTIILYGLYTWIGISSPQYFQLIYGVLIVVLVLFLPRGLMSLVESIHVYKASGERGVAHVK
jgi:branched-chain amino acid transport system permease protein